MALLIGPKLIWTLLTARTIVFAAGLATRTLLFIPRPLDLTLNLVMLTPLKHPTFPVIHIPPPAVLELHPSSYLFNCRFKQQLL